MRGNNNKPPLWTSQSRAARWDGRKRESRWIEACKRVLIKAKGNKVSPQERLLIDRIAFLAYQTYVFESKLLGGKTFDLTTQAHYLTWVNALRKCLQVLGLEQVALDLSALRDVRPDHDDQPQGFVAHDISRLSAQDQDRVRELTALMQGDLQRLSLAERRELRDLLKRAQGEHPAEPDRTTDSTTPTDTGAVSDDGHEQDTH